MRDVDFARWLSADRQKSRRTLDSGKICTGGRKHLLPHDLLHLRQVVKVMACIQANDLCESFLAALRMHAVVFPKILRQSLQHAQLFSRRSLKVSSDTLGSCPA